MTGTAIGRTSAYGTWTTGKHRSEPPAAPCWLCGIAGRHRDDPHFRTGRLCGACWPQSPSAYDAASRSSSALRVALHLGGLSPAKQAQVAHVARELGITAWCDSGRTEPNEKRFGHLDRLALIDALSELA